MMKISITILFLLGQFYLIGQKIEVEKRVPKSDFPDTAISYLENNFSETGRVKYFMEINGDSIHYEAKFKYNQYCYSVEFFENGSLEDVEKKIKKKELPPETSNNIDNYLSQAFKKYKIQKIQEQTGHGTTRYELIIKGKDNAGTYIYEFLFSAKGAFIQKMKVILPSNNITLY